MDASTTSPEAAGILAGLPDRIGHVIRNSAREHPHRPALVDATTQWSYGERAAMAAELTTRLRHFAVRPGDRMMIVSETGIGAVDADRLAKARNAQQPSYDPYSFCGVDDSGGWVGPLPVKVISVPDLTDDRIRSTIKRGMLILEPGCGVGDVSLWLAKLVGATGLVVGVDESAEHIDLAEKRAKVAGQCYWTRFITADLNTFIRHEHTVIPHEGYDAVVVRRAHMLQGERATFLRLSTWLRPDGVILIIDGKPDMDDRAEGAADPRQRREPGLQ